MRVRASPRLVVNLLIGLVVLWVVTNVLLTPLSPEGQVECVMAAAITAAVALRIKQKRHRPINLIKVRRSVPVALCIISSVLLFPLGLLASGWGLDYVGSVVCRYVGSSARLSGHRSRRQISAAASLRFITPAIATGDASVSWPHVQTDRTQGETHRGRRHLLSPRLTIARQRELYPSIRRRCCPITAHRRD